METQEVAGNDFKQRYGVTTPNPAMVADLERAPVSAATGTVSDPAENAVAEIVSEDGATGWYPDWFAADLI